MTVRLRLATPADGAAVAALYAPYVRDTCITFEYEEPDGAEFGRRIETVLKLAPWLLAVEAGPGSEKLLGYAYGTTWRTRVAYRWVIETAIYVDRKHHRRGIGRALYGALLDLLRMQGFCRAIGGITLPNPESVGLHERLGFRFVGNYPKCGYKHGTWWDVGFWDLEMRAHPERPEETLGVEVLMARAEAAAVLERAGRAVRT
ncbi:MAG: N-acetyltransferase family protein [Planctomycetes bacterium]|nr:N-acetyltransferase family protein [Planctomycetota bacterium]